MRKSHTIAIRLMRFEADNHGGSEVTPICEVDVGDTVMCMDQFDTSLESLLIYGCSNGTVGAWDIRCKGIAWKSPTVPCDLGVVQCMSLSTDGLSAYFASWNGGLCRMDLRFQRCVKQWQLRNQMPILALRPAQGTLLAALGTGQVIQLNEKGNTVAVFENGNDDGAVEVPILADVKKSEHGVTRNIKSSVLQGTRCLWTPRNGEFFLSADRYVRYWTLDVGQITHSYTLGREASVTSNVLGDVFVARCAAEQTDVTP